MTLFVERIVSYCARQQLISEEHIPWLRYGLEKRIYTIAGVVPFAVLAIIISNAWDAICFLLVFFALRSKINGYHSDTLLGCFGVSLVTEILFLKVFCLLRTSVSCVVIVLMCCCILFCFAPYNHPNIHYSENEITALKKSIRCRLVIILLLTFILQVMHFDNGLCGLTTGVAMATFMLCLAYYSEWRKNNEQN